MIPARIVIPVLAILTTACASTQTSSQSARASDAELFDKLKTLEGTFLEVEGEGEPAIIEYRVISRGTAVTETWIMPAGPYGPDGKSELTVFHMDNGALVATHYCGAGIHPTMVLDPDSAEGSYDFVPRTIANLSSSNQNHNSGFGYRFEGTDIIHRSETWSINGEASVSHLRMERSAPAKP